MIGDWIQQDIETTEAFCRLHAQESGEKLEPSKVSLFLLQECPYDGYWIARLHIEPQTVFRNNGATAISKRSFTYALLARDGANRKFKLIPIWQTTSSGLHNIFEINDILGLYVTSDNVLRYMTFFGQVIWNPPFYFFESVTSLGRLIDSVADESKKDTLVYNVRAVLGIDPDGRIGIRIKSARYPLLGSTVTFEAPCLFKGDLYLAKMRISHYGRPEMDDERRLEASEIYDPDESLDYYPLDFGKELREAMQSAKQRSSRLLRRFSAVLYIDAMLLMWILPLFLFQVYVTLGIGLHGNAIAGYFDHLRYSTFLSVISLVLGCVGIGVAVFRYAFLEILIHLRKLVPSIWTYTATEIESQLRKLKSKLGTPFFFFLIGSEHLIKALMCVTLLLYGVAQFLPPLTEIQLNFGQALTTTLAATPLVGHTIKNMLSVSDFAPITLPSPFGEVIEAIFGFLISTIIIGIIVRTYHYTNEKIH
ncbi:hypothetical protein [Nitrosomonas sp. Nm58]|uniref:hypothetical protein n=1 Tax=Nitrosomonas sp. Nm58 TaxID=200126 RepID=UPI000896F8BB|nr:hypothetical protein [Nitrosomonas sp. Nm58]SDY24286.1 hypothetical protein SAMN05421754_100486 [Nitrosomonas sp. Nm58]